MAISDAEQAILTQFDETTSRLGLQVTRVIELLAGLDKDDPEFNTKLTEGLGKLSAVADALEAAGKTP